ncbi:MAG TPA: hypothetical protein VI454_08795 [Verrucomicrobiae bacterium]|jgi:hypothetical protein
MKIKPLFLALVVGLFTAAPSALAQKLKTSDVSDYPFFNAHKRGQVAQFSPGLTAALLLTDAQKQGIAAARDEVFGAGPVANARRVSKSDPSVTAEQREAARKVVDAANATLRERVGAILTAEQKALIERINKAFADASELTSINYEERFVGAKGDDVLMARLREEAKEELDETFLKQLKKVLNAEQTAAMARAAEIEQQRSKATTSYKKPVK